MRKELALANSLFLRRYTSNIDRIRRQVIIDFLKKIDYTLVTKKERRKENDAY